MSKFIKDNKFHRKEVQDQLYTEPDLLVFTEGKIYRLEGLGPVIWEATEEPQTLAKITKEVVAMVGAPPSGGAKELVVAALEKLIEEELIAVN
ncbi:MAG: hypothetical protein QM571_02735 [Micrococcaceae bacterium]